MSAPPTIRHIKASERVEYSIDCAHCQKPSLLVSKTGVMSWESPHTVGDKIERHANAVTVLTFIEWWIERAGKAALINLRGMIEKKLERMAA